MPHYRTVGDVPRKRHVRHTDSGGHRYAEELIGQQGFSSASSLLYHRDSPSAVVAIEPVASSRPQSATPDWPLVPRHVRTEELAPEPEQPADAIGGRTTMFANADVTIAWVRASESSGLYRDAVGDQLVYLQQGTASLESVFGAIDVRAGHYIVIPGGVTHRWVVESGPLELLVVSARGHVGPPRRYLTPTGQFVESSPYCERDLVTPEAPLLADGDGVPVLVRSHGGISRHIHRTHPFDVVGWDGCIYPWAFHIEDFEPIVGRVHQPPPVHQTFEGPGFVVCSFVPRPFDFHPDAVKIPYHHSNVDSDEILFYSAGNFMSRAGSGIGVGSISFHPAGFVHGPQPGSYEASVDLRRTEEIAVMIDTFAPLSVTDAARTASDPSYTTSWSRPSS